MNSDTQSQLIRDHSPQAVKQRLLKPTKHSYLADGVLGGIDGCITTFAIVSSSIGAGFPNIVAIVLGLANLIADGFSMAASNFQAAKSRADLVAMTRQDEEAHIDLVPEGEKEEVRQIFVQKGFTGDTLEDIVRTITSNRTLWVDTMLKEEHGLPTDTPNPYLSGAATFIAFFYVGFLPLIPFIIPGLDQWFIFPASCIIAVIAFFGIGVVKGAILKQSMIRAGIHTLCIGSAAAIIAYMIGDWSALWVDSHYP